MVLIIEPLSCALYINLNFGTVTGRPRGREEDTGEGEKSIHGVFVDYLEEAYPCSEEEGLNAEEGRGGGEEGHQPAPGRRRPRAGYR